MMRPLAITALLAALASCTGEHKVESPPSPNSVTIGGSDYRIEELLYDTYDILYLDEQEGPGIKVRVMADGATISADLPMSGVGTRIDLSSRDKTPVPGDLYFTFYVSADQVDEEEYGRFYARIMSWSPDQGPFKGWFSISPGEDPDSSDDLVFEWELTDGNGAVLSKGYIDDHFEPISV